MIDYRRIADAIDFYKTCGFNLVEVPWAVTEEANRVTLPRHVPRTVTPYGDLVGSAEQSFIDLIIDGELSSGKHMAVTPCWRIEEEYNDSTRPWFMKLELIEYGTGRMAQATEEMVHYALTFFNMHIPATSIDMDDGTFDIVSPAGIELGSYGSRSYIRNEFTHEWVYGTGLAEPRLSVANKKHTAHIRSRNVERDVTHTMQASKRKI